MKISGFETILQILSFKYHSQSNTHTFCEFLALIKSEDENDFCAKLGAECQIQGEDTFKFAGIIKKIETKHTVEGSFLKVFIEGFSIRYDTEVDDCIKKRIFQSPKKIISDIIASMNLQKKISINAKNEDEIKEIIVQDYETDWNFLLRLSSYYNLKLFPSENSDSMVLGDYSVDNGEKIESADIEDVSKSFYYLNSKIYKTVNCSLRKYLTLGERVSFENDKYIVESVDICLIHNTYQKTYILKQYVPSFCRNKTEYVLQAKVVNNEDPDKMGKIQVEFLNINNEIEFEDVMKDNPIWIETLSLYATGATGVSFLPQKGDFVKIIIKNGSAFSVSSIRNESLIVYNILCKRPVGA